MFICKLYQCSFQKCSFFFIKGEQVNRVRHLFLRPTTSFPRIIFKSGAKQKSVLKEPKFGELKFREPICRHICFAKNMFDGEDKSLFTPIRYIPEYIMN